MQKLFILFLFALLISCKQTPQTTEWRGTNRTGVFEAKNLLKSWPQEGPSVLWEVETLGNGYSSPIVTDEHIYVSGEVDSIGYLFKLDQSGNEIWRSAYGKEWTTNFPGPRGTPTLAGELIYLCSGLGDVFCKDVSTGKTVWQKSMLNDLQGVSPRFGYSQALVVHDDFVYCQPGGTENNLVALNRYSGELIWAAKGVGERPAYNSPCLFKWGNKKILAAFSAYHLLGFDSQTGQLLWTHEQTNTRPEDRQPGQGDTHGNTILFDNGFIYYAAADGNGGIKLALNETGDAITEVWTTPKLDNFMGGFVKLNNTLYTGSHRKQQLVAINSDTSTKTDSLKLGRGITIAADSMLYFYSNNGTVSLIEPSSSQLTSKGKFRLKKGTKEHYAHPAIHNGKLYLRHGNYLGVYDIQAKS